MATEAQLMYRTGQLKRFSASAALTPGDVELSGNRITVVSGSKPIAIGDDYTVDTTGIFNLDALSTDEWVDGAILYWDATNNRLTDTASTHKSAGLAVGAKVSGETKALCDINASVGSATV